MSTFLVEIGCEELPADACAVAAAQAPDLTGRLLADRRLPAEEITAHVAPRRIAVVARGVPPEQPAERLEHRGPPERVAVGADGELTPAAEGFARRHGLQASALTRRDGFVWAVVETAAAPAGRILGEVVDGLVAGLAFPRHMRWGTESRRFARPIRWIVALLDGDTVDVDIAGVRSGDASRGRRFRGGDPLGPVVPIPSAEGYLGSLAAAGVLADQAARRARIVEGLDAAGDWIDPAGVLDEVVYLAEWPAVLRGSFDERYLDLPPGVVRAAMQSHQRYLPFRDPSVPGFLFVSGGEEAAAATIVAGNERVLRGRLDDAAFSVARDRERGLAGLLAELAAITYHAGAGSLADRAARLERVAAAVADTLGLAGRDHADAVAAAPLLEADLASTLVGEFPELEGVAGGWLARQEGLDEGVAEAIAGHVAPRTAGDAPPATVAGAVCALADRLDTLVVAFALGERPTGSRDPYGLRRAAAGIAAIVLCRTFALDLALLAREDHRVLEGQGAQLAREAEQTGQEVASFVLDRVDVLLEADGMAVDILRCARGAGPVDVLAHVGLVRALARFDVEPLRAAVERARRLLLRHGDQVAPALDPEALEEPAERHLHAALERESPGIASAVERRDFPAALRHGSELAPAIDRLFDETLVMADDPAIRANRLRLLLDVAAAVRPLGDLSALPG
jgi:glycyl-tRNA synthetase beta chain